jgi:hypothetical protein
MGDLAAPSEAILADIQACRSQVSRPATPRPPAAAEKIPIRAPSVTSEASTASAGTASSCVSGRSAPSASDSELASRPASRACPGAGPARSGPSAPSPPAPRASAPGSRKASSPRRPPRRTWGEMASDVD